LSLTSLTSPTGTIDLAGNFTVSGNFTVNGSILAQKLTAEEIKVGQLIIAVDATAGKAILPAGSTELTINSPHITTETLIYVTPIGDSQNQVLYVKSKQTCQQSEGSDPSCFPWFKVAINQPLPYNLEFNWWIIQLEEEKTI